jgi:hypothetical protein
VAECRRLLPALVVSYEPGWETRGNGTSANYDFGNWHHTASVTSAAKPFPTQALLRNGRPDLSGPLCNFAGPWCTVAQPRLHVVAANPANHAGASRASGPVPALALYNPRTLGLELDYAGSGPMAAGQELVAKVWGRAVAKVVGGGNIEVVRAHFETSVTGKWDIGYAPGKSYDMVAFRRDAQAFVGGEGDIFMALSEAEQRQLLETTNRIAAELMGPDWRKNQYGWPAWRVGLAADKQPRQTIVDYLRGLDQEIRSTVDLAGRPAGAKDTIFGHVLSSRVLAQQGVEQSRLAATRAIEVDPSKIDMSKVQAPATLALNDEQMDAIAERVADLIAMRMGK